MKLLRKRPEKFEGLLRETYDIWNVLQKEGKTDGECRAYVQITSILLLIDDSLFLVCRALFFLLGLAVGKILSDLF